MEETLPLKSNKACMLEKSDHLFEIVGGSSRCVCVTKVYNSNYWNLGERSSKQMRINVTTSLRRSVFLTIKVEFALHLFTLCALILIYRAVPMIPFFSSYGICLPSASINCLANPKSTMCTTTSRCNWSFGLILSCPLPTKKFSGFMSLQTKELNIYSL